MSGSDKQKLDTHDGCNLDLVFINLNAESDFRISRTNGSSSVEKAIARIHGWIQAGCFKIVSLNASEHSCVLVMSTNLSRAELREKNFPYVP